MRRKTNKLYNKMCESDIFRNKLEHISSLYLKTQQMFGVINRLESTSSIMVPYLTSFAIIVGSGLIPD
jgi:hypothetical protein